MCEISSRCPPLLLNGVLDVKCYEILIFYPRSSLPKTLLFDLVLLVKSFIPVRLTYCNNDQEML